MSHAMPRPFPAEHHVAELHRVMAIPAVAERMARSLTRNGDYDVPDLAGYSVDGERVYFDRSVGGMSHDPLVDGLDRLQVQDFLEVHEHVEKTLIDVLGYSYAAAHELATCAEHEAVRAAGFDPAAYEKTLKPFIKRAATEKITNPPPDLDCHPYYDDPDAQDLKILARLAELGVEDALEPQVKLEHQAVRYGAGRPPEFCKGCEHYTAQGESQGRCHLVRSPIEPLGWCVMWQKRGSK